MRWFQSLEGILSDLEGSNRVSYHRAKSKFQSLEGILSDLETFDMMLVIMKVSIPRRDFIGFRGSDGQASSLALLVSIPRRDFIGFRGVVSSLSQFATDVSIPRRDFIGFRARC